METEANEAIYGELLKMDRHGRVQTTVQQREAFLDEFEQCGVSAAEFARGAGINYTTFASWRQKRAWRRAAEQNANATMATMGKTLTALPGSVEGSGMRWVEAVVEKDGSDGQGEAHGFVIELPGGARVEVRKASQAKLAAELLRELALAGKARMALSC